MEPVGIAVIGMGCRFPGGVKDPEGLWRFLRDGLTAVSESGEDRFGPAWSRIPEEARATLRFGAFLPAIDQFDAAYFKIPPAEARKMDPQQRLFLEICLRTLEHAGIAPSSLKSSRTGVFAGVLSSDYAMRMCAANEQVDAYWSSGNETSFLAGRVAHILGLTGPVLTLATACSSSLTALDAAVRALREKRCNLAIAGGVNLVIAPENSLFLNAAGALSKSGGCRVFDASADGIVRGDGCGAVLLKRLDDALADGDRIEGVIKAVAVNHDGPGIGLTMPSATAQTQLMNDALNEADLNINDMDYLEAHGTGTPLGDPTEMAAVAALPRRGEAKPLSVGSSKANFGHTDSAAGMAGLIKVLMMFKHRCIPPQPNFQTPHPKIDFDRFKVHPQKVGFNGSYALVNAFGLSGVNAAVVVAKPPACPQTPSQPTELPFMLSAKSPESLSRVAEQMGGFLDSHPCFTGLCYTAAVGRDHHRYRLIIIASSIAEIKNGLSCFLDRKAHHAMTAGCAESSFKCELSGDLQQDAKNYIKGGCFDWRALFPNPPKPIPMPGYAFVTQSFWFDEKAPMVVRSEPIALDDPKTILSKLLCDIVGLEKAPHPNTPFMDLGMDSIAAVSLRNGLQTALGLKLPAGFLYDYPNVASAVTNLKQRLSGSVPRVLRVEPKREIAYHQPIAVVGAACRLPGGVESLEDYWKLLIDGVDAISEIPADRWDADAWFDANRNAPGKTYTRWGGFLDAVDCFDAEFFGISPREALGMDPQQRLLLEIVWESLENAGIRPSSLVGSRVGVFIGMCHSDYHQRHMGSGDPERIDAYALTGSTFSVAAGRISYLLGLQGPAMVVDSACSSSLTALHLACNALENGDCELALVAGVNMILDPYSHIFFSRLQAMAADGRCKTFDAAADGYVRGEGCVGVVLRRLNDALEKGESGLGVIRGRALNQDGRSAGLTAPNGPAQQQVVQSAISKAGLKPDDICYVEAHGTGTPLGDPIEIDALRAVFGQRKQPLYVGSVKTNFGHLEAAAGLAGFLKAILILKHSRIPPHLHFQNLNPEIELGDLQIPTRTIGWPPGQGKRFASVSSFGFSGTNAHVVLEQGFGDYQTTQAPQKATKRRSLLRRERTEPKPEGPLVISARSPESLRALAKAYRQHTAPLAEVANAAARTRDHFEHRLAVLSSLEGEYKDALDAFLNEEIHPQLLHGKVRASGNIAFVFPGQGSQWLGMARDLLECDAAFRLEIERCDAAFKPYLPVTASAMLRGADPDHLQRIEHIQPLLFAIEIGLVASWRARGVMPKAVIGHSMGEVAAAYVAGILSLEDAASVICIRSRLLKRISGDGAMALIELSESEARERLDAWDSQLAIAVCNSPRSCVISGEAEPLGELLNQLNAEGIFNRVIKVDVASHGPAVDPLKPDLLRELSELKPSTPQLPFYSTVEARRLGAEQDFSANYWVRNLREQVAFASTLEVMAADGFEFFLEMSPHPILLPAIEDCLPDVVAIGSLKRDQPDEDMMRRALGDLYVSGFLPNWEVCFRNRPIRTNLPTYCFHRKSFWLERNESQMASPTDFRGGSLLGRSFESSDGETHFRDIRLDPKKPGWLDDHRVGDARVLPASAYLVSAWELLAPIRPGMALENLRITQPLILRELPLLLQIRLDANRITFASRLEAEKQGWTQHATVEITTAKPGEVFEVATHKTVGEEALYRAMDRRGLHYGAAFRLLEAVDCGEGVVKAHLKEGPLTAPLLDACFQSLAGLLDTDDWRIFTPVGVGNFHIFSEIGVASSVVARRVGQSPEGLVADLMIRDRKGHNLAWVKNLELRATGKNQAPPERFEMVWREALIPELVGSESRVLVVRDAGGVGQRFAKELKKTKSHVYLIDSEGSAAFQHSFEVVVDFRAMDLPGDAHVAESFEKGLGDALSLVQALINRAHSSRLYWVTSGVFANGSRPVSPNQSSLWGFARIVCHEHPELNCTRVDMDDSDVDIGHLVRLVLADGPEDQWLLRGPQTSVARLQVVPADEAPATKNAGEMPFGLFVARPGSFEELNYRQITPGQPGPGEVLIEVHSAALNFIDILKTLGLYPGEETRLDIPLGGECAGRIIALGKGNGTLQIGDEVIATSPEGCCASHLVVNASFVVPKPANLSMAEAAGVPIAAMTARYSLLELARLQPGESVLIHAAAGGVGLAAVALAKGLGATIFATAGSEEKREYLRQLGVHHVMNSRDLSFVEGVRAQTDGCGVNVVLNSLSGPALRASLSLVAPFGRFVEIGKRDIYASSQLDMTFFREGRSLFAVDLLTLCRNHPDTYARLLAQAVDASRPGLVTHFPAAQVQKAFETLSQARHMGKLVLDLSNRSGLFIQPGPVTFCKDAAYLITGGLGALGFSLANWLLNNGAGQVILLGRKPPSAKVRARIEVLGANRITCVQCDVTHRDDLEAIIRRIAAQKLPLRGIFHAAGLLADSVISRMTNDQLKAVFLPKALGAWHLHTLTHHLDLDWFVCYGSAAADFGFPGQANYAAANAFLDGLARYRRAHGLPALTLDWGVFGDGLANDGSFKGVTPMTPERGLEHLGALLRNPRPHVAVFPFSYEQWRKAYPMDAKACMFEDFCAAQGDDHSGDQIQDEEQLARFLREDIALVLRQDPARLDAQRPFGELGVDSLMSLEIRNRLEAGLGLKLPATLVWSHPNLEALADHLSKLLGFRAKDTKQQAKLLERG